MLTSSCPVSGVVEAGLVTNTYCYPHAQIIQNFFSIDETELSYKNYNVKRIPLIQCRVRQLLHTDKRCISRIKVLFSFPG